MQCRAEKIFFWINGTGTIWVKQKSNFNPYILPSTKIHFKWIVDLNVKHKIIKILEGKIRVYFSNLGVGRDLLTTKEKVVKVVFIKCENFYLPRHS